MNREEKIKLLKAIQEGRIDLKAYKPLPALQLEATDGTFSDIIIDDCQYAFYLTNAYRCSTTGREYTAREVYALMNDRQAYNIGVIPVIEKQEENLFTSVIYFTQIETDEQIQLSLRSIEDACSI